MIITIPTKYDIGQKVYLTKAVLYFSQERFINVEVPDPTPHIITSIKINISPNYTSIYYHIDGKQKSIREDKLFNSLEEVEAHCKHDSE